jgi:hypothetical protein
MRYPPAVRHGRTTTAVVPSSHIQLRAGSNPTLHTQLYHQTRGESYSALGEHAGKTDRCSTLATCPTAGIAIQLERGVLGPTIEEIRTSNSALRSDLGRPAESHFCRLAIPPKGVLVAPGCDGTCATCLAATGKTAMSCKPIGPLS